MAEITSSAKQAREFFRNAAVASDSVRALLAFYGISSLSKAVTLLFKPGAGEASLVPGHGLVTVGWRNLMTGGPSEALSALPNLEVQLTAGLYLDFLQQTSNTLCMHIHSSEVDWRVAYDVPAVGHKVCLVDLLAKLPDVSAHLFAPHPDRALRVRNIRRDDEASIVTTLDEAPTVETSEFFAALGYDIASPNQFTELRASEALFTSHTPQFSHAYVKKTFGAIPSLHVSSPFAGGANYSQLGMTYTLAYFLGMLTRYYPTQWVALSSGTRGDVHWPALNAAQRYSENCFPELVVEYIKDRLANPLQ